MQNKLGFVISEYYCLPQSNGVYIFCFLSCVVVTVEFGVGGVSVSEGTREGCVSVVLVKTGTTTVSSSLLFTTMDGGAIGTYYIITLYVIRSKKNLLLNSLADFSSTFYSWTIGIVN